MDASFDDKEKLLRAVWPPTRKPDYWVNGRLSSAALKDPRGLSVDRTADRTLEKSIEFIKSRLQGYIVSFTVPLCKSIPVYLRYCPSDENDYHSEIHRSESETMLSDEQALLLGREAVLEFEPNSQYKI